MSEKVTFTINLDGNIYSGLINVDKAMRNVKASATSTLKTMDAFHNTSVSYTHLTLPTNVNV